MKKSFLIAALALAAVGGAQAADSGVYAGINVAAVHSDFKTAANQTDTGASALVGYRFNQRYAVEASYSLAGDDVTQNSGATADQHALSLAGVVRCPKAFHGVEPFAKAGVAYTKLYDGANSHKWATVVGVGAEYALTKRAALRGEVQYVADFAGAGARQTTSSVGVTYRF